MGKTTKNFSLLMRRTNSRVSMKRLQEQQATSATASSSSAAAPSGELDDDELKQYMKQAKWEGREPPRPADPDWTLSRSTAFKILLSVRLSASLWSIISDCDEVYNYWEPLHMMLLGRGFQTWEYAPQYAIRSWLYVLLYALPAHALLWLAGPVSKLVVFFVLRFLIGCVCLLAEIALYDAVCRRAGNSVGRAFLLFSLVSPAMFGACCAFLPSAFSMVLNTFATACYLREQWFLSIFLTAASALLGWPFAALLGLPLVMHMLVLNPRQLAIKFGLYSALSGLVLISALAMVDSHFFGQLVIAPLNIVLYNVLSGHGPNLYGVEPVSFYVRNLVLNFNLALPLALLGLGALLVLHVCLLYFSSSIATVPMPKFLRAMLRDWPLTRGWQRTSNTTPFVLITMAACLWMLVFFAQPHKEERFLFPVYPQLCLLAAIGLDVLRRLAPSSLATLRSFATTFCALLAIFFTLHSVSRIYAVHRNYSATMDTYRALNEHLQQPNSLDFSTMQDPIRLCVGKEWHRFQSSFFLPENVTDRNGDQRAVEMDFVRSEFRGILPAHFVTNAANLTDATRRLRAGVRMNDANAEEPDRYVPLASCDFLVHLEDGRETDLEPNYAKMAQFRSVAQRRVLLPADSHPVFRAFYVPFTEHHLRFGTIHLLQQQKSIL